jgi:hypothetical protein
MRLILKRSCKERYEKGTWANKNEWNCIRSEVHGGNVVIVSWEMFICFPLCSQNDFLLDDATTYEGEDGY